jgi:uncharacterized protein (DUF983 family)
MGPERVRTFPERRVRPIASAGKYLVRALRLRCPSCGVSRLFRPLAETRRLDHWVTPLEGCARCRVLYEREPGYFLLATFAFNYGATLTLGLGLWVLYEWLLDLSIGATLLATMLPMAVTSVLLVRHCKALFLAMDLWVDPWGPGVEKERSP